ncbi:MAG: hypothetical protein LBT73_01375 [Tannerellaceae bacterium]|jgi:hypothetical protein|nr:hypothetical protein [Tannerellaceae bacterium]
MNAITKGPILRTKFTVRGRREKLGELFFTYAKAAFTVVFLGSLMFSFGKEGGLGLKETWPMVALGGGMTVIFATAGYLITPKDKEDIDTLKGE